MAVVRQYATLSMGWCLDCHRKSNYVGGLAFDGQPATFTVGTANYDVMRNERTVTDPVVQFKEREIAGNTADKPAAHGVVHQLVESEADKIAAEKKAKFFAQLKAPENQGLPRWRIADLPMTHQKVYSELYRSHDGKLNFDDFSKTFMNAPTHCSTCHQ